MVACFFLTHSVVLSLAYCSVTRKQVSAFRPNSASAEFEKVKFGATLENTHKLHKIVYTMSKNCLQQGRGEVGRKGGGEDVRMGGGRAPWLLGVRRP